MNDKQLDAAIKAILYKEAVMKTTFWSVMLLNISLVLGFFGYIAVEQVSQGKSLVSIEEKQNSLISEIVEIKDELKRITRVD